ncbi:helix-turn-helix transcriptional regulator [Dubosiella newyorkensis]|uniref:helix-turn-helix transcriptional regulator n=1 Tax=Dubosiella newyorkensis TaxID=1862672 RepID=UPI002573EF8A|nr:helix-turn-helix transcriptional regulator [Dubosiella newyorkensis]
MEELKMTLKAARVNRGLSQKEASSLLGISEDTLSNYERGKSYPDVILLKKIEELYQVSYNSLIFLPVNNGLSVNRKGHL